MESTAPQVYEWLKLQHPDLELSPREIFHNWPDCMLTAIGFALLCRDFEHETFTLSDRKTMTAGDKIKLKRHVAHPYFIKKNEITLFYGPDIVMMKMMDNFDQWIQFRMNG